MGYVTASLFISMCFIGGTYGLAGFGSFSCPTISLCLFHPHCCPSLKGNSYECCYDGEFYAWIFASVVAGSLLFSCCCCCCGCICCRRFGATNVSVAMTETSGSTAMNPGYTMPTNATAVV